jgi:polysaccharide biosynthesis/export protein
MKKFSLATFILFTFTLSIDSSGQAIDPSLLKNLSPAQIELAKNELARSSVESEAEPKPISESTISIETVNRTGIPNKKFGYDYFSSAPTTITALGDLPLPNEYRISLNDQFAVILSGSKEAIFNLNVNLDGTILFPELGSISVVGETLQQVKTKISNFVNQSYIGVQVDVSLKNLSAKKISIVGAVVSPGTYLVNPFTTISSALNYSGGIAEIGSLRNIILRRSNGDIFTFDLYELLIDGNRKNDITIESGDVIVVGSADQFAQIEGEVNRPSIYEILETDRLEDIIDFALGLSTRANTESIKITTLDNDTLIEKSSNAESMEMSLKNVLSVSVYSITTKEDSNITVLGAVKEPGLYSLEKNSTLEELINGIDFTNTYPWLAILEQFDELGLVKSSTLFNLKDTSTYKDINLFKNSKVFFLNAKSQSINNCNFELDKKNLFECPNEQSIKLMNDYALKINHDDKTYIMPVIGKFKLKRLVDLLGLDMTNTDTKITYINPIDDFIVQQDYRLLEAQAGKFHTVNFNARKDDLITVKIIGAVNYPGAYILKSGSSLKDLYEVVGSFKKEAFVNAIIFKRDSIKKRQKEVIENNRELLRTRIIGMDSASQEKTQLLSTLQVEIDEENLGRIAGDFNPTSESIANIILVNNDELIIPFKSYTISVLGEVLNPVSFGYNDNINVRKAIINAGGTTQFSDMSRTFIIKANGLIEKPGRNIFSKNYNLRPGDTVVVPKKLPQENTTLNALLPFTKVLSDLAFTAAALDNLSTN